jgi:hypothetical protein
VSQGDVALLTFNLINHEPVRLADTAASVPVNNTTGVSTVGPTAATVLGGTLDRRESAGVYTGRCADRPRVPQPFKLLLAGAGLSLGMLVFFVLSTAVLWRSPLSALQPPKSPST